jgi:endonuclease/exonuclease/phosphatase family metal-dependent hydrolase
MQMKRRDFLRCMGVSAGMPLLAQAVEGRGSGKDTWPLPPETPETVLRSITYNVYGAKGWPEKTGNRARLALAQPQMAERIALELAIYEPHILTLCEAPDEEVAAQMAEKLGMHHAFFPSPENFPGAVLSRFPILESVNCPLKAGPRPEKLYTRHFGRAIVDAPSGPLPVYSLHLNPHQQAIRLEEIGGVLESLAADLAADRPLLLQGDLNHRPDTPEYRRWKAAGLTDAFAVRGAGPDGTVSCIRPAIRIDYIWMHGAAAGRLQQCRTLFEGAFRLHAEDSAAFALSDHLPVLAQFTAD